MLEIKDETAMQTFRYETIPVLSAQLGLIAPQLQKNNIFRFHKIITFIMGEAATALVHTHNAEEYGDIDKSARFIAMAYTVAYLNSALPDDFPFIIALVEVHADPDNAYFASMQRDKVSQIYKITSPTAIPMITIENAENLVASGNILLTEIKFASHLNGLPN